MLMEMVLLLLLLLLVVMMVMRCLRWLIHHKTSPPSRSLRPISLLVRTRVVQDELNFLVIVICNQWLCGIATSGTATE